MSRIGDDYQFFLAGGGEDIGPSRKQMVKIEIPDERNRTKIVLSLAPKLNTRISILEWLIFGSYWELGLLEFPKVGGKPSNIEYATIPENLNIVL